MKWREPPFLETPRLVVRMLEPSEAALPIAFFERNELRFARWSPVRPHNFYTEGFWRERLSQNLTEYLEDRSCKLFVLPRDGADVIGVLNFSEFVRGSFQACFLGYQMDGAYEGKGLMSEALREAIRHAFGELRLHRIMANYQPENERSARLLERLGFVREGLARDYLFINGAWRDHVLTSLTHAGWKPEI